MLTDGGYAVRAMIQVSTVRDNSLSQKLSNHVLRKTVYSLACGANYIHNSAESDTEELEYHASLAYELLAKEALYVPKRKKY